MDEFKKITSNEWGAPYEGATTDPLSAIAQRDKDTDKDLTVASILAKDEEKEFQGADIQNERAG